MINEKFGELLQPLSRRSFLKTAAATGLLSATAYGIFSYWRPFSKTRPRNPTCMHWSFGGEYFASPAEAESVDFQVWLKPSIPKKKYSFREEVLLAIDQLAKNRNGRTIALCYSGGIFSELIASQLHAKSIPFEMYFLDFWGQNRHILEKWAAPFAARLHQPLHVVPLDRDEFHQKYAPEVFLRFGIESPTPLALTYLFQKIPSKRFIVTGEGSLERAGPLFDHIGKEHPAPASRQGVYVPFSASIALFHRWAESNQRPGEYQFFSSRPELFASMFTETNVKISYPHVSMRALVHEAFPEIKPRPSQGNWDTTAGKEWNVLLRKSLEKSAKENFDFDWQKLIGACARVDDIFLS